MNKVGDFFVRCFNVIATFAMTVKTHVISKEQSDRAMTIVSRCA